MRLDCAMSWGKTLLPQFADLDEIKWNVGREKMKESPFLTQQIVCQSHFCKLGTVLALCCEAHIGRVGGDLKKANA